MAVRRRHTMHTAGIISNCNARRMSRFISGLIFRAQSSAGKPPPIRRGSFPPPLTGRLSACVINRSREVGLWRHRTTSEPVTGHFVPPDNPSPDNSTSPEFTVADICLWLGLRFRVNVWGYRWIINDRVKVCSQNTNRVDVK